MASSKLVQFILSTHGFTYSSLYRDGINIFRSLKIFEAIGLETPVLLIAPVDSDAITITERTGLVKSFTGADVQGMVSFLTDIVRRNIPQPRNIELCSWTTISNSLDTVLRRSMIPIVSNHDVKGGERSGIGPDSARQSR